MVISPLIWVITIVALLLTPPITTVNVPWLEGGGAGVD